VRIAVNAAHGGRLRIVLVAIAVEALLAEMALAASDVERHQHVIADLEVRHLFAKLLDDATEFVAEGHADARVRDHAVIEVKVGPADAGAGDTHHRVAGMLDLRHRLFFDADPVRAPIIHCAHSGTPRARLNSEPRLRRLVPRQ
jgi:hypothetical protein